jgi:hypothetical protein
MDKVTVSINYATQNEKQIKLGESDSEIGAVESFCSMFVLCLGVIFRGEYAKPKKIKRGSVITANNLNNGTVTGNVLIILLFLSS